MAGGLCRRRRARRRQLCPLAVVPAWKARHATGRSQNLARSGPQPDGRAVAGHHGVADVGSVHRVHLHGPTMKKLTEAGPEGSGWCSHCTAYPVPRHRLRNPHRQFPGRLPDLAVVHIADLCRHRRLGAQRRGLCPDGDVGCALGSWVCRRQLDAAGQAGGIRAAARVGFGCRSTRPCFMSGKPSVRPSAASSIREISCTPWASSARLLSRSRWPSSSSPARAPLPMTRPGWRAPRSRCVFAPNGPRTRLARRVLLG